MQSLFEIASKYVLAMYGTQAVGMELLFGPVTADKPLSEYSECFPAYFRTKEVFEDIYAAKIVQKKDINDKSTRSVSLMIFPSMTINDAKIELLKITEGWNTNINGSSLLMLRGGDVPNPTWLALLDEDKFGAVALHHGLEDCFAIVSEPDAWSNCVWPVGGVTSIELIGLSPLDENDERSKRRRVRPGVNIEITCRNDRCTLASTNESVILSLGLGVFDLGKNSSFKLQCPHCHSDKAVRIAGIAFFQCRYAFTAIHSNNTRRAS